MRLRIYVFFAIIYILFLENIKTMCFSAVFFIFFAKKIGDILKKHNFAPVSILGLYLNFEKRLQKVFNKD